VPSKMLPPLCLIARPLGVSALSRGLCTCCALPDEGTRTPSPLEISLVVAPLAGAILTGQAAFAALFLPLVLLARTMEAPLWAATLAATLLYSSGASLLGQTPSAYLSEAVLNLALAALSARLLDTENLQLPDGDGPPSRLPEAGREVSSEAERDLHDFDARFRRRVLEKKSSVDQS